MSHDYKMCIGSFAVTVLLAISAGALHDFGMNGAAAAAAGCSFLAACSFFASTASIFGGTE